MKDISVVGVRQIDRIVEVVNETFVGNCVRFLNLNRPHQNLHLPKMRRNKYVEVLLFIIVSSALFFWFVPVMFISVLWIVFQVLPISSGCLNHCTYCKTKMARGKFLSYSLEDLLEQAQSAFADGCRELWLTSEDLGAWGRDIGMVVVWIWDLLYWCALFLL